MRLEAFGRLQRQSSDSGAPHDGLHGMLADNLVVGEACVMCTCRSLLKHGSGVSRAVYLSICARNDTIPWSTAYEALRITITAI